jgi:hypothetical protein
VPDGRAATDAAGVFYAAADVVEPAAQELGAPLALERQQHARYAGAVRLLQAFPEDQTQRVGQFQLWATEAERLRDMPAGNRRLEDRDRLAVEVDQKLLRWAGANPDDPRTNQRSPEDSLRSGAAMSEVRRVKPALADELGIADVLQGIRVELRDRFEGRMVDGLATAVADRTGRSDTDVVKLLCSMDRHSDQWATVSRLLVSDEAMARAGEYGPRCRSEVKYAMLGEFRQHYGNPDREATLTPEEVGSRIVDAGETVAGNYGVDVSPPDPDLDATMLTAYAGMSVAGSVPPMTADEEATVAAVESGQKYQATVTRGEPPQSKAY